MQRASRYDATALNRIATTMGWSSPDIVQRLKPFGMTVTSATINNWRRGRSAPTADKLDVLAMALGVGVERFYRSPIKKETT